MKKFEKGMYVGYCWSYDGGFNRGCEIYKVVDRKENSVKLQLVCEKYDCDCNLDDDAITYFYESEKPFSRKIRQSKYDWMDCEYVRFSKDGYNYKTLYADKQTDNIDNFKQVSNSYYILK